MPTYISMLRGINVAGHNMIKMEALSKMYGALGFKNVRTYIQSGNVIFEAPSTDDEKLADKIEKKIESMFGFHVQVAIRTKEEIGSIIKKNPLAKGKDIGWLHVTFLSDVPKDPPLAAIMKVKDKAEEIALVGKEVYLFCPNGYGRSNLNNNFLEKKLGVSATTRNWNTVNTLFEMAGE